MSRREKLRQEMLMDIKAAARQQMAEGGTAALSLSGIARTLEVSQPALYRYYPSREALVTALIVEGYNNLADAMAAADQTVPQTHYGSRLLAAMLANRSWALENPVDFQLLFGNPIPGYQGPEDITTPAAQRVFGVVLNILMEALAAGALQYPEELRELSGNLRVSMSMEIDGQPVPLPPEVIYIGLVGWTHTHGMIMLELFNHTRALLPDPGAFYLREAKMVLNRFGLKLISLKWSLQ
jgi:AcrR family transcriptional regulator